MNYDENDKFLFYEPGLIDVVTDCVIPTYYEVIYKIGNLLVFNAMFSLITFKTFRHEVYFHIASSILGAVLIHKIMEVDVIHFHLYVVFCYVVFKFIEELEHVTQLNLKYSINVISIGYILICELYYPDKNIWTQSRGLFMIATMKFISMSSDIKESSMKVSVVQYFGYIYCPANSVFGPWISCQEYVALREIPQTRAINRTINIIKSLFLSFTFLTVSNCWGNYLVHDDKYKWLVAYRQALSFRSSHYFISYMSETAMLMAGYIDEKHKVSQEWKYQVCNVSDIELPTCLVNVVTSWNIPMHKFLKKYVYRNVINFGQFIAIIITYFVSSLLHGLNVELATVLLTIGVFSYIQLKFQDKLAEHLNTCIGVRPCKSCRHMHKRGNFYVKCIRCLFSILTVLDLVFLGILMDFSNPSLKGVYAKWSHLNFLNPWLKLVFFCYTFL